MAIRFRLAGQALLAVSAVTARPAAAQAPGTDIFLLPLDRSGATLAAGPARNVTNRPGYDNQPSFSPDGRRIFFTSIREDAQADIYSVDLASLAITRVTSTPESEYSPTVMPGGRELAVIRVELDSTQRLWAFPLAGGAPRLLLRDVKPVGYQAWIDSTTVGLFVLGTPPSLQVADLATNRARRLLDGIGRSLTSIPGTRRLTVTRVQEDRLSWLTEVDPAEPGSMRPMVAMPHQAEYVAWHPDGYLLTVEGTRLLRLRPGVDGEWVPVADLATPGMGALSRLAVSPDGHWLAVVAAEPR